MNNLKRAANMVGWMIWRVVGESPGQPAEQAGQQTRGGKAQRIRTPEQWQGMT